MEINLLRPLPAGVGHVTQWFGEHPEWYAKWGYAGHNGLDYSVPIGTPVLASIEGIIQTGDDPAGYGLWVKIVNGFMWARVAHLSAITVKTDQHVAAGEQVGLSGNTGNSSGPHVHFEIGFVHGRNPAYGHRVDPLPFRLMSP